jgi:pepF/M3 family oligoendopeptidase
MSENTLPHWDFSVIYPGLDCPQFEAGFEDVIGAIADLASTFDRLNIQAQPPAEVNDAVVQTFDAAANQFNRVLESFATLSAYITGFVTTNSRDEAAQARQNELRRHSVTLSTLGTRFTAWLGSLDVDALIARSAIAADHAYTLRKTKVQAGHLMSPAEEEIAAELAVTGGSSWAKLYNTYTSQISVSIDLHGKQQDLPMPAIRNLAYDPNREIRKKAYEAELAAWRSAAVPIASALNSIKGEMNTLSKRRHWESPLAVALFNNNVDRATLDAMFAAARESFPDFRRYLRAKAKALGVPVLAWYDLFAPVGHSSSEWSFEQGRQFIVEHFGAFSDKLRGLAERAFSESWIDAEPRSGKVGGAFCMRLRGDESRILANYKPSFGEVSTLAHELGHAYHNVNLSKRTALQRGTPMTLAETASTFCQTIVQNAALAKVGAEEQLLILEGSLQDSCQVVVDITSRFLFEEQVFEHRRRRDLSVDELNALMLDAQKQTYGDGLDPEALHPMMWAAKSHYYGSTFYNFPYMFGLLFGLGLYARYRADPQGFQSSYDELLSMTGMGDAAELAARFGIDIRSTDFWRASLAVIRADIDKFERLTNVS